MAPNDITLDFTKLGPRAAQPVGAALASATNSNANVFGYAPLRIGRRISEVEVKFNF